jgi:hypothetical protein
MMLSLVIAGVSPTAQIGPGPAVHRPAVSPDGNVAFRLRAPEAKKVPVIAAGRRLAMRKNGPGVWSEATEARQPDLYTFAFSMDGARFNHPGCPLFNRSYDSAGQSTQ